MKEFFILSYGCDLDHNNIDFLVKERLMPYSVNRTYLQNKKHMPKESDVCLYYDVFDINRNKHKDNIYYVDKFYINEVRLKAFMYSLSKLKGNHIYANPKVRGHSYVSIDNVEYTGRVYESLVDKNRLVFLDEESSENIELRNKLPLLPRELHFLTIPNGVSFEKSDLLVANWIKKIKNHVTK